ncbi:MAG TPA: hypothetical protein VJW77_14850 [Terriglobia bacterium]|nr:hypothetical protein [Terriglobia bacterium]
MIYNLAIAVLVVAASSIALGAQREIRIPLHAYMPPDFPASVDAAVPTPQYLPAGYELWRVYKDPDDGFRTGKAEVEVRYQDPGCWTRKIRCDLQIFVSPMTQQPFSGTAGRSPEPLTIRIGNRTVEAQYCAGAGTNPQIGPNFNVLVFPLGNFMIGIRGSKQGGVGRSELIRVAESLASTKR